MTPDELGRFAYETYCAGLQPTDIALVSWDRMNSVARKAWVKAATAVAKEVKA